MVAIGSTTIYIKYKSLRQGLDDELIDNRQKVN